MAAFAPSANAVLIAYFNFEDAANGANPDFTSEADQGLGVATTITTNYLLANMVTIANVYRRSKSCGRRRGQLKASLDGSQTNRAQ